MSDTLQRALDDLVADRDLSAAHVVALDAAIEVLEKLLDGDGRPNVAGDAPRRRKTTKAAKPRGAKKPRAAEASSNGHGTKKRVHTGTKGRSPAEILAWRKRVLAPVLKHPKGSEQRAAARRALAEAPIEMLDGSTGRMAMTSFYLWEKQIEG